MWLFSGTEQWLGGFQLDRFSEHICLFTASPINGILPTIIAFLRLCHGVINASCSSGVYHSLERFLTPERRPPTKCIYNFQPRHQPTKHTSGSGLPCAVSSTSPAQFLAWVLVAAWWMRERGLCLCGYALFDSVTPETPWWSCISVSDVGANGTARHLHWIDLTHAFDGVHFEAFALVEGQTFLIYAHCGVGKMPTPGLSSHVHA